MRFRRRSRRATPYGEAQLLCSRWGLCYEGLVLCSHIVGRANFMCVCFLLGFDTDDLCFLVSARHVYFTKFGAPSHVCFCVSVDGPGCSTCMYMAFSKFVSVCVSSSFCNILGSAHDVLPLMVLVSVGCNKVEENNPYRPLCKVLWVCRCVH